MTVLVGYHPAFEGHDPVAGHPESPARLAAVLDGIAKSGAGEACVTFAPRRAENAEIELVHDPAYLEELARRCASGGFFDQDTAVGPASYEAALRAAGAGLEAIGRLRQGEAHAAFLVARPPGHHALPGTAMGFCLLNNAAIAAAALAGDGERVLILDWDAHHGNGTQEVFYERDDVCYISLHQYPLYPGTGAIDEIGEKAGRGTTVNLPFPAGTSGEAYRRAFDELIAPVAEEFSPSWLVVSAGFDAHRADPLASLGLTAADFADLTERASLLVPPGRRLLFLEGGYDLEALACSAGACVAALAGLRYRPEAASEASHRRPDSDARAELVVSNARALHCSLAGG